MNEAGPFLFWSLLCVLAGMWAGSALESYQHRREPAPAPAKLECNWTKLKPWVEECAMHSHPMVCRERARELFCKEAP